MTISDTPFSRIQQRLVRGELIAASREISAWMALQPDSAEALALYAHLLRLCGRYQEAVATLTRSLALAPEFAPSMIEMARLSHRDGQLERAHTWYDEAYRCAPDATEWLDEWCEILWRLKRNETAVQVAARWCEARPDLPQAWFSLGLGHQQNGSNAAALAAYDRAMTLDADYPMLCSNLSALYHSMGNYPAALRTADEGIRVNPDNALSWTNAANAWLKLREPDNALIAAERACALSPEYGSALLSLNNALKELQRWDDAFDVMVRAAHAAPHEPEIKWSIAMLQLLRGDYENGLVNHEARWTGSPELQRGQYLGDDKQWRGEDLAGKKLLIWGEQGFGDAFQFVRFVPQIAERVRGIGGTLTYCCFPELVSLFERALARYGVRVMPYDPLQPPDFDFQLPVGSLPLALGVTVETLPALLRYLEPDPARVAKWRAKLPADGRLKVGLVWSGSRQHQRNPLRAVPAALYAQVFTALPGVEFFSLQIDGADEVEAMSSQGLTVVDRTPALKSFEETAALISSLDLVITVCTSVAHLAGALGVRTWLLLDVNPHWVWMLERTESPWYPSLTLYRQEEYGNWLPVLRRVRADLLNLIP